MWLHAPVSSLPPADLVARAAGLLSRHPVVDGHNDLAWVARTRAGYDFDRLDLASGTEASTHTDLPRLRLGGVGGQFWSVFVPASLQGEAAVTATLEQVDWVREMVRRWPADLALATTADQVESAMRSGRIASLMGAEGGHSIDCSLGTLRMLHLLGVRYLTLTHNDNVPWADSATDEPVLGGLSRFGEEVVAEMNRLGMLVDLSHVSADTMRAALAVTTAPPIFSHSSARAVCDTPRNVPDDVLASLAEAGGVVMVTLVPDFVSPVCAEWSHQAQAAAREAGIRPANLEESLPFEQEYAVTHPKPAASIADVVAHFEHIRDVCGVNHVGIGGDYDGVADLPVGLEDVSTYPRLFAALMEAGWSDDELAQVANGNLLRVLRDAEDVARDLQRTRSPSTTTMAELDG